MEWYGFEAPGKAMSTALHYAERALALNRALANAYCTIATVKARYEWDWRGAAEAFRHTLALNPGLSRAHFAFALDCLTPTGQLEEALRTVRNALQLDPLSPLLHTAVGGCLYRMRRYSAALESLEQTLDVSPSFYHAHWSAARVLEQLGRYDEAVAEYQAAIAGNAENPLIAAELGHCYGVMGRRDLAEAALWKVTTEDSTRYRSPFCAALVQLGLPARADALRSLSEAAADRSGALIWVAVDPRFDCLREEPEFENILRRMRFTSSQALRHDPPRE
jgi:tetratricopeptide (TPR) repeat protein